MPERVLRAPEAALGERGKLVSRRGRERGAGAGASGVRAHRSRRGRADGLVSDLVSAIADELGLHADKHDGCSEEAEAAMNAHARSTRAGRSVTHAAGALLSPDSGGTSTDIHRAAPSRAITMAR